MHLLASTIRQIVADHPDMRTHVLRAGGKRKPKKHQSADESADESLGYTGRCKKNRRAPCKKGFEPYARPAGEEDDFEMCCMRLAVKGEERFQRVQILREKEAELATKLDGYEKLEEDEMFDTPVVITKPNGNTVEYTFTPETLHLKIESVRAKRDRVIELLEKAMPFTMTMEETRDLADKMQTIERPEERTDSTLQRVASAIWGMFTWRNAKRAIGFLAKVALVLAGFWLCCWGGSLGDMHDTLSNTRFGTVLGSFGKAVGWGAKKLGSSFDLNVVMRTIFDYGTGSYMAARAFAEGGVANARRGQLAKDFNERNFMYRMWNAGKIDQDAQHHAETVVGRVETRMRTSAQYAGCGIVLQLAVGWFFYPVSVWVFSAPTEEEKEEKQLEEDTMDILGELQWRAAQRLSAGDDLIDISV